MKLKTYYNLERERGRDELVTFYKLDNADVDRDESCSCIDHSLMQV